ncbi:MAG TPA: dihydrolipoamide acetyltransferase family protein [Terriglobia bacterium]|nr:dihydrolipoamide acetyltransferase family protein [Terriglobia bacterium]
MKHNIIMPDLGQTVDEGKVVRWLKKPGDKISKGDVLLEVETDKVTMDVEAYKAGYLRSLLVEEGQMATAMTPIAILTDDPDEPLAGRESAGGDGKAAATPTASSSRTAARPSQEETQSKESAAGRLSGRMPASPAAKIRAAELGLDLRNISGSGPDGLITRRDLEILPSHEQASWPALPMAEITVRSVQTIPHFYVTVDAEVASPLRWREDWNRAHPDLRASLNDVFMRAASLALRDVPALNVRYREGRVEQVQQPDILMVVAADPGLLLVPIADPGGRPWEEYLRQMRKLVDEARRKRGREPGSGCSPALAVSNLGMHGVKEFTAIIPPGSAAVLSIGAVRETVLVKNRQMRLAEVCALTLALDHRVVDGVTAAKFLERMQVHLNSL